MNKFTPPMSLAEWEKWDSEQRVLRIMAHRPPVEGRDFITLAVPCSPPELNGNPARVAPTGEPGLGVCISTESICGPSDIPTAAGRVRASTVAGPGVCIPRNAGPWRQVSLFLDEQHLASLGLRMLA